MISTLNKPNILEEIRETVRPSRVGMISLGCAKNLVDAEIMLGSILAEGMEITSDAADADVLIVNTCSFIDSAKEESIEAILEAHQQKGMARRPGQRLIVSGCMAQRFSKELSDEMREVDAFMGLDQVAEAGSIVRRVLNRDVASEALKPMPLNLVQRGSRYIPDYDTPRYRLTPAYTAYVKIAEGCNHPCSFCVIPQMRGRHRSRTIASVVAEVRQLVESGVKEINLISQDTTYFGMDLWEQKAGPRQPVDSSRGPTLSLLLQALQEIPGDFWIRLLYTHPAHWSDELIATIAGCDKVARYIDMPLQHIHPEMLRLMRRETSREHIEDLIVRLREGIRGLALRTTFIVGFPGETDEHFESLLEFAERVRFERMGIFNYSQEEGSRAAKMEEQVPQRTKASRHRRAMRLQQQIAAKVGAGFVGRTMRVLMETDHQGRSEYDAPDIDGRVVFKQPQPVGDFLHVKITGTRVYDLLGEPAGV